MVCFLAYLELLLIAQKKYKLQNSCEYKVQNQIIEYNQKVRK